MLNQTDKIRVAVLYGGCSPEHEVSIRSAEQVIQNLDPAFFHVLPIGIDKRGNWFLGHDVLKKSLESNQVVPVHTDNTAWFDPAWTKRLPGSIESSASATRITSETGSTRSQTIEHPLAASTLFDVVFPVVHGASCEDGSLQGLLELANLPYVGCGVLSSAIGMDKDVSKRLAMQAGIPVAPYLAIRHAEWQSQPEKWLQQISAQLSFPLFVKPANTGSSIGISKVKTPKDLPAAIDQAFCRDTKILIEQGIEARELEIAVLQSLHPEQAPSVSIVGEVRPRHEFYSYEAKYQDTQGAELLIPAPISAEIADKARKIAADLFSILECESMARVDLFLDKNTQQLYFNEINTLPGFTSISMYPKLMAATGMNYASLLTHLIQLAINRYNQKSSLIRYFDGGNK